MGIKNVSREDKQKLISISAILEREEYYLSAEWLDKFIERIEEN